MLRIETIYSQRQPLLFATIIPTHPVGGGKVRVGIAQWIDEKPEGPRGSLID